MQKLEYMSLIKQKFVKIHDFRASLRNRAVVKSKSSGLAKLGRPCWELCSASAEQYHAQNTARVALRVITSSTTPTYDWSTSILISYISLYVNDGNRRCFELRLLVQGAYLERKTIFKVLMGGNYRWFWLVILVSANRECLVSLSLLFELCWIWFTARNRELPIEWNARLGCSC